MTEDELAAVEATYGFSFPPDLRAWLGGPLPPRGPGWAPWMDWSAPSAEIRARLAEPFDGVAPYFEDYDYWLPPWGERPAALADRLAFLATAPVLIPLAGQHFMAAEPCEPGNPVFSIVGIDMIVAGCDLADYLAGGPQSIATKGQARHIRFWSDVMYIHWSGWHDVIAREVFDKLRR